MFEALDPFLNASDNLAPSCLSISDKLGCAPIDVLNVYWQLSLVLIFFLGITSSYTLSYVIPFIVSWFRRLCAFLWVSFLKWTKRL